MHDYHGQVCDYLVYPPNSNPHNTGNVSKSWIGVHEHFCHIYIHNNVHGIAVYYAVNMYKYT